MEWNKTEMTKAELEKKQREFIEEAMRMAKKGGIPRPVTEEAPDEAVPEEIFLQEPAAEDEMCENDVECEDVPSEQPSVLPLDEASEELSEDNDAYVERESEEIHSHRNEEETTYGVFDADELMGAIESGEITGDGLKQAAEMLREMTERTKAMKKLLEEQESRIATDKKSDDGSQFGLNSCVDRHNTGCRGCRNGKFNTH